MTAFYLNRQPVEAKGSPGRSVLDYIRQDTGLTATKSGCREGDCGACMVLWGRLRDGQVQYRAVNSCLLPVAEAAGTHVVTLEGLNRDDGLTPVQDAMHRHHASQCGFCTPGIVNSLSAFFLTADEISIDTLTRALDGNLCRCTGYASLRRALDDLNTHYGGSLPRDRDRIRQAVDWGIVPDYFLDMPAKLGELAGTRPAPEGLIVGGATDLLVQHRGRLPESALSFESMRNPFPFVGIREGMLHIDGNATVADLASSEDVKALLPDFEQVYPLISATSIRNRATVAGNFVNASPIGDLSVYFLPLGAQLIFKSDSGSRQLPLSRLFLDYKVLDIRPGERLDALLLPLENLRGRVRHFEKISKRKILDIASVNSAISLREENGRILDVSLSAGGVAPVPLLLTKTSEWLRGRDVTAETVRQAGRMAVTEIHPIDDIRGSAEYKGIALDRSIRAHFAALFPERIRVEELL